MHNYRSEDSVLAVGTARIGVYGDLQFKELNSLVFLTTVIFFATSTRLRVLGL